MRHLIPKIAFLLFWLLPFAAVAQTSVMMSPTRAELNVKAGKQVTDALLLTNVGDTPSLVSITTADWDMNDEGSVLMRTGGKAPDSASHWVKVNPTTFTIAPGDHQQVRYTVSVPNGIEEKGYRTAIIIRMRAVDPAGKPPLPSGKGRSIEVNGQFNYYVYLKVGHPLPKGRLTGFKAVRGPDGIQTEFSVKNTGNVHFRTKGTIAIKDHSGHVVGTIQIPSYPVLPDMNRTLKLPWKEKTLPAGVYSVELRLDIGRDALLGTMLS
jgi:hypothetical protein